MIVAESQILHHTPQSKAFCRQGLGEVQGFSKDRFRFGLGL